MITICFHAICREKSLVELGGLRDRRVEIGRAFEHAERIAGQPTPIVSEDVDYAERGSRHDRVEVCTILVSIQPATRSAPPKHPELNPPPLQQARVTAVPRVPVPERPPPREDRSSSLCGNSPPGRRRIRS